MPTTHFNRVLLTLLGEDGKPLAVHLTEFKTDEKDGELDTVEMTVEVPLDVYKRIDKNALFQLAKDVRGPGSQRSFRDDAPVELELRLDPSYLTVLEMETSDYETLPGVITGLSDNEAEHALLATENWYAIRVKQEELLPPELRGPGRSLKSGFETVWLKTLVNEGRGAAEMKMVLQVLEEDGWNWAQGQDKFMAISRYQSEDTDLSWNILIQLRDKESFLLMYSMCPLPITDEQLATIVEYITRANTDLPIGNFEVNFETLDVSFKTSLDFEGADLTPPLVRQLIRANAAMMERYLPGLRAVIEDNASVDEALRLAEG